MIGRKEPWRGMERVAQDRGAARHAAMRWRGRCGEAARRQMENFLSFLEIMENLSFLRKSH
jgi:hypothetical protein